MVLMSILAWSKIDINWTTSTVSGGDKLTSVTQLMTAIGIGWGITWLSWSSDYTRFFKPDTPERKVFLSTFLKSSCRRCGSGSWARRSPAPARKPIQRRW